MHCNKIALPLTQQIQTAMIQEETHLSQKTDSYEALASLSDSDGQIDGVAQIRITVTNESFVSVDTCGRSRKAFQDLKSDVVTRLEEAGFNTRNLNFGDL